MVVFRPLSIALLGTRGIPGRYGGFETFAEQLSTRLVFRGHRVIVYGRKKFFESKPACREQGVEVRFAPTFFTKYSETPLAAFTSCFAIKKSEVDCILVCNAANALALWILKLKGIPHAINIDGIERHRKKWGIVGKCGYLIGEWCARLFADTIVADADVIADYLRKAYRIEPVTIAYGAEAHVQPVGDVLKELGIIPRNYILYVSRLEPENNALGVIEAYSHSSVEMPLVVVGDAPYADEYKAKLRERAGKNVLFAGFRFGAAYQELQSHAAFYIQATEVGGTHPALIEAMAYGNAIIVNGTPENLEVIGDTGVSYPKNNFVVLAEQIQLLSSDASLRASLGEKARQRAQQKYCWDSIVDQYEELFYALTHVKSYS